MTRQAAMRDRIVEFFRGHQGQLIERDEIEAVMWGDDPDDYPEWSDNLVGVHVSLARRRLKWYERISAIRGVGWVYYHVRRGRAPDPEDGLLLEETRQ